MGFKNVPKVPYQGPEEEEASWVELNYITEMSNTLRSTPMSSRPRSC